jgi:hypothetical protein
VTLAAGVDVTAVTYVEVVAIALGAGLVATAGQVGSAGRYICILVWVITKSSVDK